MSMRSHTLQIAVTRFRAIATEMGTNTHASKAQHSRAHPEVTARRGFVCDTTQIRSVLRRIETGFVALAVRLARSPKLNSPIGSTAWTGTRGTACSPG